MEKELKIIGEKEIGGMKIKCIEGGFGQGQKCILFSDVAKEHSVEPKRITELINRNIKRYTNDDLIDLCSEKFKDAARALGLITSNNQKYCYLLSETGYLKLIYSMKDYNKKVAEKILTELFDKTNIPIVLSTRKEIDFIDSLEKVLEPFNIKGIRQYPLDINGRHYRIDYYIKGLNVAIEYDENNHSNYSYEEHEGRQKEIEDYLHCRFIRVADKESDLYNVGLTIKEIFNL